MKYKRFWTPTSLAREIQMKISLGPTFQTPTDSWPLLRAMAERADAGPYHAFASLDRLAYNSYEPIATLAAVAAITTRVRLMTAVLVSPLRNAGVLAKQAATVDAISGGRLTLGLAVGSREDDSLVAPAGFHDRGRRFTEQLQEMRRIWAGDVQDGATYAVGPMPVQAGGPELILGGTADRALDRVGKYANGYVMGGRANDGEWVKGIMERVNKAWAANNRVGNPRFVATLPCAFGPMAEQQIEDAVAHYYGGRPGRGSEHQSPANPASAEAVRDMIAMHEELGTDEIVFRPATLDLAQVDQLTAAIT
jgi:alkanesulfonate monooxygenase SsuD/methylene tetrahydromethanopterin reductase-like flavin-dependent oxidoreductase (luciferase family)